jgi:hypothetical protein
MLRKGPNLVQSPSWERELQNFSLQWESLGKIFWHILKK